MEPSEDMGDARVGTVVPSKGEKNPRVTLTRIHIYIYIYTSI